MKYVQHSTKYIQLNYIQLKYITIIQNILQNYITKSKIFLKSSL